jgi:hypothetical protein
MKNGNPIYEFQVIEDFVTTAKPKTKTSPTARVLSGSEYEVHLPLSSFLDNAFYSFWINREYT